MNAGNPVIPQAGGAISGTCLGSGGQGIVFTLYSREYCHLCHDMLAELDAMRKIRGFDLTVVDVDSDPGLEARFGDLVPVLYHQARELARYRLAVPALEAYLDAIGGASA